MRKLLLLAPFFLVACSQQSLQEVERQEQLEQFKRERPVNAAPEMAAKVKMLRALEQAHIAEQKALLKKQQLLHEKEQGLARRQVVRVHTEANGVDPISEAVSQLSVQLNAGLQQHRVKKVPVAVMPFMELGATREPGELGDRLGESFIYQLQQHGYNLVDYRAVSLNTTTKPVLSKQNLSGLRTRYKIYFILTGTYARYPDGVVVNARVLDTTTRQVLATGQTHINHSRLEGQLPGYDALGADRKGLIIENQMGPVGR